MAVALPRPLATLTCCGGVPGTIRHGVAVRIGHLEALLFPSRKTLLVSRSVADGNLQGLLEGTCVTIIEGLVAGYNCPQNCRRSSARVIVVNFLEGVSVSIVIINLQAF